MTMKQAFLQQAAANGFYGKHGRWPRWTWSVEDDRTEFGIRSTASDSPPPDNAVASFSREGV